jgi:hypothetical protein
MRGQTNQGGWRLQVRQAFACRIRVTDVKILFEKYERNDSPSDCKHEISQDENRQNGRAQDSDCPTAAFSRPQGAGKKRLTQWIRLGKFVLLKRLAANITRCTRFARAVDKGSAMEASFAFVCEDYLAIANAAFVAGDLHLSVNETVRDNPETAARRTQSVHNQP